MRITDIDVDGFGIWTGLRLENLSPEITVFYGPNEAGKTTLLQFIRSILYGFGEGRRERHLPPRYGGAWGGSLEVVAPSGAYRVERHLILEGSQRERETLAIESNDGVRRGVQFLERLLSGIDETICTQVFAVGLHELQQLASLNDTQAAEQLYGLATGRDRVSLHDVARRIHAVREYLGEGNSSRIAQLTLRQRQLRDALENGHQHAGRWDRIREKWEELEKQTAELQDQKISCRQQMALLDACQRLREPWRECLSAQTIAQRCKEATAVPYEALLHLQELANQISNHRKQKEEIEARLKELDPQGHLTRQAIRRLGTASGENSPKSTAELDKQYTTLDDRVQHLSAQLEETDFEIQAEWEQCGLPTIKGTDHAVQQVLQLTPQALHLLRPTARTLLQTQRNANTLKQQYESTRRQLQESQKKANAAAGLPADDGDLYAAIRRAGELVSRLRKRQLLADNERQFENYLGENRSETNQWLEMQLLPYPGMLGLALLFGAGGLLLLNAMLGLDTGWWPGTRGSLWGVGLLLCALAIGWKVWMQWINDEGLAETERQSQRLRERRHKLAMEIRELEQELPPSPLPLADRLRQAEQELQDLETLLAQDGNQLGLHSSATTLQLRTSQIEDAHRAAQQRWQFLLRTLGLQDQLPADKIDELADRLPRFQQLRDRRASLKRDRDQAERDRDILAEKLDRMLLAAGKELPTSPRHRRDLMSQFVKAASDQDRQRRETQEKILQIQRELRTVSQSARAIQQQQAGSCIQHGIRHPRLVPDLLTAHQHVREWQKLKKSFKSKLQEISKQCGCSVERIEKTLRQNEDDSALQSRYDQCGKQLQIAEKKLEKLQEQRGVMQERMRTLQQDRSAEDQRRELTQIEHELRIATKRWQVVSTVSHLLEQVRSRFERDRQPETLAEASVYLSRMTLGKYERIWTPFGEADLRIDTNDNESLSVEQLSRGTREQVFLALRLALAASYGRRGTRLPVVLDDVLVNFDVARARAAAGMLQQFAAQGNQVLVFTCHEHIRDIFREIEAETRELPRASEIAAMTLQENPPATSSTVSRVNGSLGSHSQPLAPDSGIPQSYDVDPSDHRTAQHRSNVPWDEQLFGERKRVGGRRKSSEKVES